MIFDTPDGSSFGGLNARDPGHIQEDIDYGLAPVEADQANLARKARRQHCVRLKQERDMSDDEAVRVAASHGKAARVSAGQHVKVVNIHGTQVVDTWAFNAEDLGEHMSMAHSRSFNSRVYPVVGESLVTNRRRPMLRIVEDTSPGIHDTLLCACNREIYQELGIADYHRNCQDNLHEALKELGFSVSGTPDPLNLFMNIPVLEDGSVDRRPPESRPGDYVVLRAEMDLVIAFSACPQDVTPINGPELTPRDVEFSVV